MGNSHNAKRRRKALEPIEITPISHIARTDAPPEIAVVGAGVGSGNVIAGTGVGAIGAAGESTDIGIEVRMPDAVGATGRRVGAIGLGICKVGSGVEVMEAGIGTTGAGLNITGKDDGAIEMGV